MAVILVAGQAPGVGASTVAAGLAHRAAYAGRAVRLERLAGDDAAAADAAAFAAFEIADASGEPIAAADFSIGAAVTILEAPIGANASALAADLSATLVEVTADPEAQASAALFVTHASDGGPFSIPEDRRLAAPTVGRLIEASGSSVLSRSVEGDAAICENIVAGPIAADANAPYFERFDHKVVITRAEKVDIVLAAMSTSTACLILTGGGEPSPYLVDRVAASRDTTLLLAPGGTVETLREVEDTFGSSAFAGELKLDRIGALMRDAVDDEALAALIGS